MTPLHVCPACMCTNQFRAHSQPTTLWWSSYTLSYNSSTLIIPGCDTRQLGAALTLWSLLKSFKPANPQPAYLPHAFLPAKTTIRTHVHIFPCSSASWLTLVIPLGALCHVVCALFLEILSNKQNLFYGRYLLICWPHHPWIIIKPTF